MDERKPVTGIIWKEKEKGDDDVEVSKILENETTITDEYVYQKGNNQSKRDLL